MTGARDWQGTVGRSWAAEWRRTDASFAELTPHLLALIATQPGECIVDVGCGAGELSIALADARPNASVVGIDISADLIDAASARTDLPNLTFEQADATQWQPRQRPDLYVSRHGVMFFPDPPQAFSHLARVAAPHARIVFSCFRKAVDNAWVVGLAELLPAGDVPVAQPFPPGPFAFADPDHVRRCMAGWRDHTFTPVDFRYVAGQGDDPVGEALALFRRIGPAAPALRDLPQNERSGLERRLQDLVEAHLEGGRVVFPAAAWLVTASSDHRNG
ncbi:class I SAM-dependent methyltransferase [Novosphingobium sp. ERN07]|uniref:class I SAM-dependent methyltransferase n=1 Tax=Novosphingobium sp. ERN07 TaxID=2726187 RepID=UPI0014568348|nr:class I SAM-dependent methyltransferase [Novosphingobium sp. ERN07]NLR71840.1 class I SAM-dependent methyltransferase [Novosphingobium sp. ERN07]